MTGNFEYKGVKGKWITDDEYSFKLDIHFIPSYGGSLKVSTLSRYFTGNCQSVAISYFNDLSGYFKIDTPAEFKEFFTILATSIAKSSDNLIESLFGGYGYFFLDINKNVYGRVFKDGDKVLDIMNTFNYVNTYDNDAFVYLQIRHSFLDDIVDGEYDDTEEDED